MRSGWSIPASALEVGCCHFFLPSVSRAVNKSSTNLPYITCLNDNGRLLIILPLSVSSLLFLLVPTFIYVHDFLLAFNLLTSFHFINSYLSPKLPTCIPSDVSSNPSSDTQQSNTVPLDIYCTSSTPLHASYLSCHSYDSDLSQLPSP